MSLIPIVLAFWVFVAIELELASKINPLKVSTPFLAWLIRQGIFPYVKAGLALICGTIALYYRIEAVAYLAGIVTLALCIWDLSQSRSTT